MRIRPLSKEVVPFFEIFITSLIILVAISINRGIMYEHRLRTMEYPPGFTAIGVSYNLLDMQPLNYQDINRQIVDFSIEKGAVSTIYQDYYNSLSDFAEVNNEDMKFYESFKDIQIISTENRYFDFFKPSLRLGRYFSGDENDKNVCVIGEEMARRLFSRVDESLGKKIKLPNIQYSNPANSYLTIVGVLKGSEKLPARAVGMYGEPVKTVNVYSDYTLIVPAGTVSLVPGDSSTIWIDKDVNEGKKAASELSESHPGMKYTVNPELATFFKSSFSETAALYALNGFAALLFIVAGMGIVGIQLIKIGRRKEEIGLSMAFGARRRNIAAMVLKETMIKFLLPSIAGILAGLLSLVHVSAALGIPVLMDIDTVLIFAAVTALFAALTSLYPALKAASLDPVKAMGRTPGFN